MTRAATESTPRWRKRRALASLDPTGLRDGNRRLLLNLLWSERELSRADLARATGLARSTVSAIALELLASGLVTELGAGDSSGGRRPIVLGFKDDAFGLIGIDLGATHISVAATDLRGGVKALAKCRHDVREDPVGTLTIIDGLIDEALSHSPWPKARALGIGVAAPSPIDPAIPNQLSSAVLPAWAGHDIVGYLNARHGLPVFLDNDANLGALAELWWGAGVDCDDLAYIKIATGVGAGFIVGGALYRGATGIAGEIGHLVIDPDGARCMCGMRGCLVTQIGAVALVGQAEQHLSMGLASRLTRGGVTLDALIEAAQAGDTLAVDVVRRAGRQLGVAVANVLNLLNPSRVVLSGGLVRAGAPLFEALDETLRGRALFSLNARPTVTASSLGSAGVALGAATQVLMALLDERLATFPSVTAEAS